LFSARDEQGRAHIGRAALEVDGDTLRAGAVAPEPLLGPGELGAFDDSGVTGACLVERGGGLYLYYSGWSLGRSVPFYFYAGLAFSEDRGCSFQRVSQAPVLERSATDPFLTASPWVIVEDGRWRMWYVSATGWEGGRHRYNLRYAESGDGIAWERPGLVSVDFAGPGEYAIARPCVVRDGDRYRMWFSARGASYRIGYAESADGLRWERCDGDVALGPAGGDWDAEMQAYPLILDAAGARHMLYNGNGYGATGIGYATLAAG
jgi:hypothetical protein